MLKKLFLDKKEFSESLQLIQVLLAHFIARNVYCVIKHLGMAAALGEAFL